jgi:AAA15 family ATPase/GTPase
LRAGAIVRIDRIKVKNFRGFEECEFGLAPQVTVFIGANGTGKTAILDALAIGAGSYLLGIDGATAPSIEPEEVRRVWHRASALDSVEQQFP